MKWLSLMILMMVLLGLGCRPQASRNETPNLTGQEALLLAETCVSFSHEYSKVSYKPSGYWVVYMEFSPASNILPPYTTLIVDDDTGRVINCSDFWVYLKWRTGLFK
jgi:hypothetical protein